MDSSLLLIGGAALLAALAARSSSSSRSASSAGAGAPQLDLKKCVLVPRGVVENIELYPPGFFQTYLSGHWAAFCVDRYFESIGLDAARFVRQAPEGARPHTTRAWDMRPTSLWSRWFNGYAPGPYRDMFRKFDAAPEGDPCFLVPPASPLQWAAHGGELGDLEPLTPNPYWHPQPMGGLWPLTPKASFLTSTTRVCIPPESHGLFLFPPAEWLTREQAQAWAVHYQSWRWGWAPGGPDGWPQRAAVGQYETFVPPYKWAFDVYESIPQHDSGEEFIAPNIFGGGCAFRPFKYWPMESFGEKTPDGWGPDCLSDLYVLAIIHLINIGAPGLERASGMPVQKEISAWGFGNFLSEYGAAFVSIFKGNAAGWAQTAIKAATNITKMLMNNTSSTGRPEWWHPSWDPIPVYAADLIAGGGTLQAAPTMLKMQTGGMIL